MTADDSSEIHFRGDGATAIHTAARQTTKPTITASGGAPVNSVLDGSNDTCGQVTIQFATNPSATIAFNRRWTTAPNILITPLNASAVQNQVYVSAFSNIDFVLTADAGAPVDGAVLSYFCMASFV